MKLETVTAAEVNRALSRMRELEAAEFWAPARVHYGMED